VNQPTSLSSRDDTGQRAPAGQGAGGAAEEIARLRARHDDLAVQLRDAHDRLRVLEQKLKQSLMHLVTAEGVRGERDQLRNEVVSLRRRLAGLTALEAELDDLRARLTGVPGDDDPGERLSEALDQLVRMETIRTERQGLRARLAALEEENERLREEVARLGHPSAQRRVWLPKLARHE
jgi:chromosome segregation ATPase